MKPSSPDPEQIRAARLNTGLSQRKCAELVYVSRRSWQVYEEGTVTMKLGLWELFLFKTGQLWIKPLALATAKKPTLRKGRNENLMPFKPR